MNNWTIIRFIPLLNYDLMTIKLPPVAAIHDVASDRAVGVKPREIEHGFTSLPEIIRDFQLALQSFWTLQIPPRCLVIAAGRLRLNRSTRFVASVVFVTTSGLQRTIPLRRSALKTRVDALVTHCAQEPYALVWAHRTLYRLTMLALRLPPEIEERLDALAKKTGRSKSYYAREAILRHIEDIEDYYLARRRLGRGGPRVTLESLERDLKKRAKS